MTKYATETMDKAKAREPSDSSKVESDYVHKGSEEPVSNQKGQKSTQSPSSITGPSTRKEASNGTFVDADVGLTEQ